MTSVDTFDPVAFKQGQRAEWETAAAGWWRWYDVLEAAAAGRAQTDKLLELARVGPGDAVLDVATGYGEPGVTAARAVQPGGRVVLTDIAGGMLAYARQRAAAAGLDNVELVESDAEDLTFDEETFDAVLCRHGLQFLIDVAGALSRYREFLKPGGRLAALVWGPPQRVQFSLAVPVIRKELGLPPPPTDRPGIFALADRGRLTRLAEDAGFADVDTGSLTVVYEADSPQTWTEVVRDISAPIARLVDGQAPDVVERVWQRVTEAWAPLTGADGRTRVTCEALWVSATR